MKKLLMGLVVLTLATFGGLSTSQAGFWEKTEVSGQFNTSYNFNFNNPPVGAWAPGAAVGNHARVFDTRHNDFDFNRAELELQHTAADWAKFRLDLAFGEDIATVDGLKGGVIGVDEFGVQQAYAELTAPVGNGLTFTLGHFATIIGAEVIESAYNYNTSRSFLFGFAIPFTHTGLLITYPFNDLFSASLGVVNGWDLVTDTNKMKTFLWQLAFTPSETLDFSLQGAAGMDRLAATGAGGANDSDWTMLVDFVLNWQPIEAFLLQLNVDWANQQDDPVGGITDWMGFALLAHYDFNNLFGLTVRGEWFNDDNGFRFGGGANHDLFEGTLTAHIYVAEGWETRLEFRHDHSDRSFFTKSNGTTRNFQDTFSAEVLYKF